jgi:protein O-GlcNAc transferase
VLLTEALECHDRSRFEVFAFDNGWDDGSDLRRRIEAATTLVPIFELDNLKAAQAIRERQVDVLINLNGYFGRTRSHLFSLRPAPVQVNFLGFPGTFGAGYLDYIVADHTVIPDASRGHYVEKVVRLPDSYQANDSKRKVAEGVARLDAGLPEDRFVFCCMNNAYKIVPAVFDIWMRLLAQVPDSVLMLYSDVPEAQANLRHEATARGVDPERILFGEPWVNERHLARLRLCDLFLDTWPYNAHTTGSDALWAGLPVVTCMGESFPSRVGASLLRAVGLPELVTENFANYEALALRLATDRAALARLRERLAAQLPTAALYDTARYTRHLEAAFAFMTERARLGLAPAAFDVPASA